MAAQTAVRGSDFARLSRQAAELGLLRRRPVYHGVRAALVGVLLLGGWTAFFLVGDSWYQLVVAAFLALVFAQVAFLGHDIGHRQVFRTKRASESAGLSGNLLIGLGYGWWMDKHTRHHANPNDVDHDPDVAPGALIWTGDQARPRRGFAALISRWQAPLFFPMLFLEGLNLHVASVQSLFRGVVRRPLVEGGALLAHFAGYLGALFLVLPPGKALVFLAVHKGLWGFYMGCVFAPNHKGMLMPGPDDKLDFLRKQVLTSRNVRGGPFVDVLMGGLNYQIEHHLFPSMPTGNLRKVRPLVRAHCASLGIPYYECGLFRSYAEALSHLHEAGAPLRAGAARS
ncbi:fatty acid desaturase family protein [Rhizohabitans arisaemae]|uniref:fatty acid desaturase family protein n=1 Tax=Rhizohabitans arisaemae TaxID=2720610 RepID=UPI0024B19760|nr:acyl-CoA desaturase [Rhizohabitans arisaemae]